MASTVATPLERHLGAIADVDDMTSSSSVGTSSIQLTFGVDRDIDGAARDVQAAIVAAHADLPSSLTRNPSYRKINSALFPVMAIAMTSDVLTQGQIYDAADAVISQRLSQIQGVGGVNVNGSALPAVRIEINPLSLSKYGIGLQDVRAAISNSNANAPKGAIESDQLHYQIYTNDNARDAAPYRNLIIANRNGSTVRLGDVATVLDMQDGATENIRTYGLYNGKPAVFLTVFQQPGANVIQMIDAVKAELPMLKSSIDPKIDLVVTFDRSITIRASLRQVEQTLMLAVAMVILVVYMFLNSHRAALIPALVVPVSLIGTFGAMYLLGYTLDNFSLMALTIATGFVVDDAIVVMENTTRHIEAGMTRVRAALLGAREVGFTVVIHEPFAGRRVHSIPVRGRESSGGYSSEFTVTLSVAIMISLVISLTTTPMMCSLLLEREDRRKPSRFARAFERGFERLRLGYGRTPRLGIASPAHHAAAPARDDRSERLSVCRHPQGFLSAAGHRTAARRHPRRCNQLVSVDEGQASGSRENHPTRSGGQYRHGIGRERRLRTVRRRRCKRERHRCTQAAGGAAHLGRSDHYSIAAEARPRHGRPDLPAGRARHRRRRPIGQLAIPIYVARR